MIDDEKLKMGLRYCIEGDHCYKDQCPYYDEAPTIQGCTRRLAEDALQLIMDQQEQIVNGTETIERLTKKIVELREYMTPYGKIQDVKAYLDMMKFQPPVVKCKECRHFHHTADNVGCCNLLNRFYMDDWFCASGKKPDVEGEKRK